MKMKKFFILSVLALSVGLFSCGGEDEDPVAEGGDCSVDYTTFLASELQAYAADALAYSTDPTNSAKCAAYKTSSQSLIDKYIAAYKDCGLANYDQTKAAWEQSLAVLPC